MENAYNLFIVLILIFMAAVLAKIINKWIREAETKIKTTNNKNDEAGQPANETVKPLTEPKAALQNTNDASPNWIGLVVLVLFAAFYFGGGFEEMVDADLQRISDKVAVDAVEMYQIAKREGNNVNLCVQAGLVTAAFLQAKDERNYRAWKEIEEYDCSRAGLR